MVDAYGVIRRPHHVRNPSSGARGLIGGGHVAQGVGLRWRRGRRVCSDGAERAFRAPSVPSGRAAADLPALRARSKPSLHTPYGGHDRRPGEHAILLLSAPEHPPSQEV
ncbi:hypothetical protein PJI17_06280 [Mycobacterium kansasii]